MALRSKGPKSRQPPSQADGSLYQSSVATPEIEASLVDRMRKRFGSSRNPGNRSASDSGPDAESDVSRSSRTEDVHRGRGRDTTASASKRNSLGQRVARIDKFFSPERPSTETLRSPTRFPSGKEADVTGGGPGNNQRRGAARHTDSMEEGQSPERDVIQETSSQLLVQPPPDEPEPSRGQGSSPSASPSAGQIPRGRPQTSRAQQSAGRRKGGRREQAQGGAPRESAVSGKSPSPAREDPATQGSPTEDASPPTARLKRQRTSQKTKGPLTMIASGNVEAHMADKEFIGSQVRALTTPFVLESGPRSWMQIWKGQQSGQDGDPLDIPASVTNRIVTKINLHMDDIYQRRLARQRQRSALMSLDELRKTSQEESQKRLTPDLRQKASLDEVIASYPSEWSDSLEDEDTTLAERYSDLRARLFALSQSLPVSRRQRNQLKCLKSTLESIKHNVGLSSSADLKTELSRTVDLVAQIKQKLAEEGAGRKQPSTQGEDQRANIEGAKHPPHQALDHSALVRALFKTAVSSDTG